MLHFIINAGSASNVAIMVAKDDSFQSVECKALIAAILSTREFDEIEQRVDDASFPDRERRIQGEQDTQRQFSHFLFNFAESTKTESLIPKNITTISQIRFKGMWSLFIILMLVLFALQRNC